MKTLVSFLFFLFLSPSPLLWSHETPKGPILLTITGKTSATPVKVQALFDAVMLKEFPQHTVTAATPWTDDVTTFSGPLLRDILEHAGAYGTQLLMTAANKYQVTVPVSDTRNYDCILAMSQNGQVMTVRTKGPLWLIYPWDTNDALRTETYYSRSIWQLTTIDVQ